MTNEDLYCLRIYLRKQIDTVFHEYGVSVYHHKDNTYSIQVDWEGNYPYHNMKTGWDSLIKVLQKDGLNKTYNISEDELTNYYMSLKLQGKL